MNNKSLLSALMTVGLAACGGGDDGDNGGNNSGRAPVTAAEITSAYVQEHAEAAQFNLYGQDFSQSQSYAENKLGENSNYFHETELCTGGLCMENSNDQAADYDDQYVDKYEALGLKDGKTVRYRTANDIGTDDDSVAVDGLGKSRFIQIYINQNDFLTPAREAMVREAVARMESVIGDKVFNSDIKYAQMAQFVPTDINDEMALWGHENVYTGYQTDYDATTTGAEVGDSYQKLIARDGVRGGIIFSFGTAPTVFGEKGCEGYKANVAPYPYSQVPLGMIIDEEGYITNENWKWVNLGQRPDTGCNNIEDISLELVKHEFGHGLGLSNHFEDFGGERGVWGLGAEAVLKSIYAAPVNSRFEDLALAK